MGQNDYKNICRNTKLKLFNKEITPKLTLNNEENVLSASDCESYWFNLEDTFFITVQAFMDGDKSISKEDIDFIRQNTLNEIGIDLFDNLILKNEYLFFLQQKEASSALDSRFEELTNKVISALKRI